MHRPATVSELAEALSLEANAVRFHLAELRVAGLLSVEEVKSGAHRPSDRFRINTDFKQVSFPADWYQDFSEALTSVLKSKMSEAELWETVYEVGRRMGRKSMQAFATENLGTEWDLGDLSAYLAGYYARQSRLEDHDVGQYDAQGFPVRIYRCRMHELALQSPDLMCDCLHAGYNRGREQELGDRISITITKKVTQGDDSCETLYKWKDSPKSRSE